MRIAKVFPMKFCVLVFFRSMFLKSSNFIKFKKQENLTIYGFTVLSEAIVPNNVTLEFGKVFGKSGVIINASFE